MKQQLTKLFDGKTKKSRPLSNRFSNRDIRNIEALSYNKGWGFSMVNRAIITKSDKYTVTKSNGYIVAISDSGNTINLSHMMNDKVSNTRVFLKKLKRLS